MQQIGHILFVFGILAAFGILVGLVNIVDVDTSKFLIAGIALEVIASAFKQFSFIGAATSGVMIFVGGALLAVAMRVLLGTALATLWKSQD